MKRWSARWATAGVAIVWVWLAAAPVHAHPLVDEAVARMDEADWDGALGAFSRAEAGSDLSVEDLVTLCVQRASLYYAIGDTTHGRRDLRWLAALRPNLVLGPAVPPPVRQAFDQIRASASAISISVSVDHAAGAATRFRVRVNDEPEGLVRAVRISYRTPSAGWSSSEGRALELPSGTYEYYTELIGPGAVVLASEGTRDAPMHVGASVDAAAVAATPAAGNDDALIWGLVGGGAGVVVLAVVIGLAVGLSSSSDQTAFGPPMLRMP